MAFFHLVVGLFALAANLLAAAWGGRDLARRRPSSGFWPMLRLAQTTLVVQVLLGLALVGQEAQPPSGWHVLAGVSALAAVPISEGVRATLSRRLLERSGALGERDGLAAGLAVQVPIEVAARVALRETRIAAAGSLAALVLAALAAQTSGTLL